ncbi:1-deoxy-D-xylulose-5-phosphate reductoisomerase [Sebaldella sp. S0638]|uniref:1-deoxy-D-xylulose-5-phosphate reductoisomerase n=1 Tax=Sebaldella sp. S0638 TaxID=2957809 RepID=UPI0020A07F69|nr:1-deoxy-D-xylulose-5-phosphate reductoisomerase [Sebaldella sp. S0638]MCP1225371.1 1-deoxy-D-xylulose-5-phosphate reductoisomerase [Sebaldella sp. S0638]
MQTNISILGATGSIGKNALSIIRENRDKFNITALSADKNWQALAENIREFNPKYVSVGTQEGYDKIKNEFPGIEIFMGCEGLKNIGQLDETDILLTAVSGSIGLPATVEAIKKEKRIALANKETMVAGGYLIRDLLKEYNSEIIPVDSEHSAVFQSLKSGNHNEIERIILTASGGPFRGADKKFLENVTLEQALKHPNWSMGAKITIDSSTLVNKGLEVIEAHHLFLVDYDKIDVIVHPQSIIHSMVEFRDKSVIAQMGEPDMKTPILYAFTYPERVENKLLGNFDFMKFSNITFEKVDFDVFRGLRLAYDAGKLGESYPIVYNAANEAAVDLFMNRKINYTDIYRIIEDEMNAHKQVKSRDLDIIMSVDREIKEKIYNLYK